VPASLSHSRAARHTARVPTLRDRLRAGPFLIQSERLERAGQARALAAAGMRAALGRDVYDPPSGPPA